MTDLKWLAEGWAKVAAGTHAWEFKDIEGSWYADQTGPNGGYDAEDWRTVPAPNKKIKLSKFIGSCIDIERDVHGQIHYIRAKDAFNEDMEVRKGVIGLRMGHWHVTERSTFDPDIIEGFQYAFKIIDDDFLMFRIDAIKDGWEL